VTSHLIFCLILTGYFFSFLVELNNVPSQETKSCICVLRISILRLFTIFLLNFRTVQKVWYVLFFILIDSTQSAIELCAVDVNNTEELLSETQQKWPTSFWTQYRMLTWRTFKQSRGHVMNKYDMVQCIFVAILAGTVFFQIDLSFRTLRDEMGVVS